MNIFDHLDVCYKILINQSIFRPNYICNNAIVSVIDDIVSTEQNEFTVLVLL